MGKREIKKYDVELIEQRPFLCIVDTIESKDELCSLDAVVEFMRESLRLDKKSEEYIYMIALNTAGCPIGLFEISHGTVNTSIFSPREIYIRALLCGATNILLVHNHPAGNVNPSKEDVKATKKMKEAGELIRIPLIDHIIIGGRSYFSFWEGGLL